MKVLKIFAGLSALLMLCSCGASPATTSPAVTDASESTEPQPSWPEPDKLIALTFDDGPSQDTMDEILDVLAQYDAKATFFIIGRKINAGTKEVLQRAVDEGHELGNHSMNHLKMAELTEEEIVAEYEECQKAVKDAVGVDMYYFRAPFGSVDDRVRQLINAPFMKYTASAGDGTNVSLAEDRAYKVTSKAHDGGIVIMHCYKGNTPTVEALKIILPELKSQGYKFVTLTQLYEESNVPIPVPDPTQSYSGIDSSQ